MRILTNQGYVDSVGVFFELSDEQLEIIKKDRLYFYDKRLYEEFNKSKGENAHFYCVWNSGDSSVIYKNIKSLLKEYKTVSWWDQQMSIFKIIKRR